MDGLYVSDSALKEKASLGEVEEVGSREGYNEEVKTESILVGEGQRHVDSWKECSG